MTEPDKLLSTLHELSGGIMDLEVELKPLRQRRDLLILKAIEIGITEMKICAAASVTRAWIWKLKLKHGLVDPVNNPQKYNRRRSSGYRKRMEEEARRAATED